MNIYKEAQAYSFANEETLSKLLGEIKRDSIYYTYISVLSSIHNDIQNGLTLEDAIDKNIDGYGKVSILKIIKAIGDTNFFNNKFDQISGGLDDIRKSILNIPEEVSKLEETEELKETEELEETEELGGEELGGLEESEKPEMHYGPSKKSEKFEIITTSELEYIGIDEFIHYINSLISSGRILDSDVNEITQRINKISEANNKIKNTKDFSQAERLEAQRQIPHNKRKIIIILDKYESEEEEGEPDEIGIVDETLKDISIKDVKEIDKADDEADVVRLSPDISTKDALSHKIFDGLKNVIDISTSPPIIDKDLLNKIYLSFLNDLETILPERMITIQPDNLIGISKSDRVEACRFLDHIMAAIKEFSLNIISLTKEARGKEADAGLIREYNEIISYLELNTPSQKLLKDTATVETLGRKTVFASSTQLSRIVNASSNEDLLAVAKRSRTAIKAKINWGGDLEAIKNDVLEETRETFRKKLIKYLSLNNGDQASYIKSMRLNSVTILDSVYSKKYGDTVSNPVKHCPTCYKWIRWNPSRKALEANNELAGFRVKLYSFYRKPEPGKHSSRITKEELINDPNKEGRKRLFYFPKADPNNKSDFTEFLSGEEFDKERIRSRNYISPKTWEQINDLLSSNIRSEHEEGWHRRAAALASLGGERIKDTYIKLVMSECPYGPRNEVSGCGISYTSLEGGIAALGSIGAQPSWNGVINNNIKATSHTELAIDPRFVSKGQVAELKKTQSPGFKFSKISFSCPCYISKTNSDSKFKHNLMVVPMTGPSGTSKLEVYPTDADGNASKDFEYSQGTFGFLVCGAATSLSSFNRDPSSNGYILNILKEIVSDSHNDYHELINSLIGDGVDVNTVMALDSYLVDSIESEQESEEIETKAYDFKLRKKEITGLLSLAAVSLSSKRRKNYEKLSLICPFGHKFSVKQSLDFGSRHMGLQSDNILAYSKILNSKGNDNLREMIYGKNRMFRPIHDRPNHVGLYYEDWIKIPENERTHLPSTTNSDKKALMFKIVDINGDFKNYYLIDTLKFREAWSGISSYTSGAAKSEYIDSPFASEGSELSENVAGEGEDGKSINLSDVDKAKQWAAGEADDGADGTFVKAKNEIPYILNPKTKKDWNNKNLEEQNKIILNHKIYSLSKAIKASLRIIHAWTDMIATPLMANSLLSDYKPNISAYNKEITAELSKSIWFFDENGKRIVGGPEFISATNEIGNLATEILNRKVTNLFSYLRENAQAIIEKENLARDVSRGIIEIAILEAIDDFNDDNKNGKTINAQDSLESAASSIADYLTKDKNLVDEITYNSAMFHKTITQRMEYTSQIALTACAEHLAGIISRLYVKYFGEPDSDFYIGYDLGVNLSSKERIIGFEKDGKWVGGITPGMMENIVSSAREAGEIKIKDSMRTPSVGHRIDKFYEELTRALNYINYHAATPKTMESSKNYLVTKLSYAIDDKSSDTRNKLRRCFPAKTFNFSGTITNPETTRDALPSSREPHIAKGITIGDLPGSRSVSSKTVYDNMYKYDRKNLTERVTFATMEDAESYAKSIENNDPNWRDRLTDSQNNATTSRTYIEVSHYTVNDNLNYDGSITQIGMYGDKPGKDALIWPHPRNGFSGSKGGFAGLMLPFSTRETSDNIISSLSNLLIIDYKVVIDIDNVPTDISFLFKRSRNDHETDIVMDRERRIIEAKAKLEESVAKFFRDMHDKEDINVGDQLAEYRSDAYDKYYSETSKLLSEINKIPLKIRVASTYGKMIKGDVVGSPMALLLLESPARCYELIQNPEVRGVELIQEEKDRLIGFIIDVYDIESVRDVMRKLMGNSELTSEDALKIDDSKIKELKIENKIKTYLKNEWIDDSDPNNKVEKVPWSKRAGKYFNIVPSIDGKNEGTYVSYAYHTYAGESDIISDKESHPTAGIMHARIDAMKNQGLLKSDAADAKKVLSKTTETIIDYLQRVMVSSDESVSDADDNEGKEDSKKYNISKRKSKLERMMLSIGTIDFSA